MSVHDAIYRLGAILEELADIDFGYPTDGNSIAPAEPTAIRALATAGLHGIKGLSEFYSACDGINLPGVHNEYFIYSYKRLLEVDPDSLPRTNPSVDDEIPVVCIGSTCGDDLFAINRNTDEILFLPPDLLLNGCYRAPGKGARVVAEGLPQFLDRLVGDAVAFMNSNQAHDYMSNYQPS